MMNNTLKSLVLAVTCLCSQSLAQDKAMSRCEILPLPHDQVSMQIDGIEKLRWHFAVDSPRPYFYPFNGPSGVSLTRMGHPGAQNHDHHRSIWFAHATVEGQNYWGDNTKTRIRQKHWYRYQDGDHEAIMASHLGWFDENGDEVLQQDVVAALLPLQNGEHALELQLNFRPGPGRESVTMNKSNFGVLAVRVSRSISGYFGGGLLSNSEGETTEKQIFGKPARWMDYSGNITVGKGPARSQTPEGITYFGHPQNPRYPSAWHVRQDGWMGSSLCMHDDLIISTEQPLKLRYLLHAHSGKYDATKAAELHEKFVDSPGFVIRKPLPGESHRQYEVERVVSEGED